MSASLVGLNLARCGWRAVVCVRRSANSAPSAHIMVGKVLAEGRIPVGSHFDVAASLLPSIAGALVRQGHAVVDSIVIEIMPDDEGHLAEGACALALAHGGQQVDTSNFIPGPVQVEIPPHLTDEQSALLAHLEICPECRNAGEADEHLCPLAEEIVFLGFVRGLGPDATVADAFMRHLPDCPWCSHAYNDSERDADLCPEGLRILEAMAAENGKEQSP